MSRSFLPFMFLSEFKSNFFAERVKIRIFFLYVNIEVHIVPFGLGFFPENYF